MQLKYAPAAVSAMFDDPSLVLAAGLVPVLRLARHMGLDRLAQSRLSVPTGKGANAGGKVMALVAGMLGGADSIEDMNVLRHGGVGRLFDRTYAPSTLGSFLRAFRFGHVRQLDAVVSRTRVNLAQSAPLLQIRDGARVMVGLDDTIIEVHGYQKQGASFGYSGVRGLVALKGSASHRNDHDLVSFLASMHVVKGASATSAFGIHRPVASSRVVSAYSIVSHASSGIEEIAVFTAGPSEQ